MFDICVPLKRQTNVQKKKRQTRRQGKRKSKNEILCGRIMTS
jgi:hypothetical protein